jgi:hypothetical protein
MTAQIYQRRATEAQLRSPPEWNNPLTANLAWTRLQVMGACWPALSWLKNYSDLREAWEGCQEGCWLYWLLTRLIIPRETRDTAFRAAWDAVNRFRSDPRNRPGCDEEHAFKADAIRSVISFDVVWEAYETTFTH